MHLWVMRRMRIQGTVTLFVVDDANKQIVVDHFGTCEIESGSIGT